MERSKRFVVILAGGMGKRFWPYSRKSHPKQFLDFIGTGETLLQMTYRRFRKAFAAEEILVVTNASYADIVKEQLPEIDEREILLEPNPRNTASAIAYAALHIEGFCPGATMVVAPSDHLVTKEDRFIQRIETATEVASDREQIITLGIRPTYPEVGYGYIQAIPEGKEELREGQLYPVKTFIEKPNLEMARLLIDSGEFYWNAGLFVARAEVLIAAFKKHSGEIYERLTASPEKWGSAEEAAYVAEQYPYCPSISFDYAVMEKADNVLVLLSDIGWTDVGTWTSTYNLAPKDHAGNAIIGQSKHLFRESENNLVVADDPELLVVLQGLSEVMVVQHDDVLLICKRGEEHKLKQVVPEAQAIDEKYIE